MRKMNLAVLGTAALALALGAGAAGAQPPGPDGPGGMGPRMGRAEGMARFLGLSEAQKAEVRKLMEGRRAEHEALRAKLEENRDELQKALESASPTRSRSASSPSRVTACASRGGHSARPRTRPFEACSPRSSRRSSTP